MAYVYRQVRLDKNEVFYIGIGSDNKGKYKRAFGKGRNYHWENIAKITDYDVDILIDDISWEEAIIKEREFIALYGRKDLNTGTLVNMTDGGEGVLNFSEESRQKMIAAHTGAVFTEERKRKISESKIGKPRDAETKEKLSKSIKGMKYGKQKVARSEEHCKKLSDVKVGKPMSDATREKIAKTLLAKKLTRSAETRAKISKNWKASLRSI